ncbi:MAG TPA: hypothetical protein VM925_19270 [Labilithrix sp.]|nr:hypothetical protein [Labilithrix sp.]
MGRLLLDSEREPAKVSRVTESMGPDSNEVLLVRPRYLGTMAYPIHGPKTELLCITPCAIDLRTGALTLVFTSTRDPERTSKVDVAVATGSTVLRHELGKEKPYSAAYVGGLLSTFGGAGLTVLGAATLGLGLADAGKIDKDGNVSDPSIFVAAGAVIGTAGLTALITGIVLMATNRPEKRPGATTTFRLQTP